MPGVVEYRCDERVTPAHQSPLSAVDELTACSKCRMPPVVFDPWGLPWCSTHWGEEKKKYKTNRKG